MPETRACAAPAFAIESFSDLEADVRQSILRIARSPFLLHREVRGFVYDVDTHRLTEITPTDPTLNSKGRDESQSGH